MDAVSSPAASTPVEWMEHGYKLAEMVAQSDVFHTYIRAWESMQHDEEAQRLIQKFNDKKEDYEEVQRFGKYHPNYREVSRDIRALKREVDLQGTIARYKEAEKELESLLNEISAEMAYAVSDNIKVPTGNPFFDQAGCGGGCGSGGSCGCG
ncbi:cell fate (sporulation/competence/biofilm development) regulator YlbF (YheA/YmcA/DUF963 family) [Salsuginibacillus halophilus]|uniref:Cell fate (Sporulation/competence/biofilm development) regulator YlbF (YheA/YmcA/DUF963 family) n=1 Tax=Salsuginibacillus halophilus TaxID=517424 RepID=A0A2P8HX44_9BACI|nr:YlbF family regulator [Salsuginibacillus halophilus]PSL50813.1 cell fate (sporulation/competence/biofilm development) regulator YlbF (YheA/YmcA/DUF963 family) [Salsuginibacillus halophilus]